MKNKSIFLLTVVTGFLLLSLPTFAETPLSPTPTPDPFTSSSWTTPSTPFTTDAMLNPEPQKKSKDKKVRERNFSHRPGASAAINNLRQAKEDLTFTVNDPEGHKSRAIRAINEAIAELQALMASK